MKRSRKLILTAAFAVPAGVAALAGVGLSGAGASVPAHTHCTPPDNPLREKDCPPPDTTTTTVPPVTTTVPPVTTTTPPPVVTPPPAPPTPIPVPPRTAG